MDNSAISDQFSMLSKLMDIHGENSFKSKSYSIAAFTIDNLTVPLAQVEPNQLFKIKGIGESTGRNILSLLETGKLPALDALIENTPPGVLEMLQIKGLGPKKINIIWKELNIDSIDALLQACQQKQLSSIKGFGEKTEENVKQSIDYYLQNKGQFLYAQIYEIFPQIDSYLKNLFKGIAVSVTGSFARQEDIIDQLEYVVAATINAIKSAFKTAFPPEILEEADLHIVYKLKNGVKLKLYAAPDQYLKTVFVTSSSQAFIDAINNIKKIELTQFTGIDENTVFEQAGLPFIPPVLRNTDTFITNAQQGKLPVVIQPGDIKGIIHSHSTWSDGHNTIEEMVAACLQHKYQYLVLSDHSRSAAYAGGLAIEKIQQQHIQIDKINSDLLKNGVSFKIFKSIESDILATGALDYEDSILSSFDCIIASIHSGLSMTEEKATARLIKAIENPYTTILGHMTGRLLLTRPGYETDHKKIIDACKANHVAIEINAHPKRLDIDWKWIPYALDKGVMLSINPDAHSIEGYRDTQFGVYASQKGGLTKEHNLSSMSLTQFEAYLDSVKS